MRRKAEAFILSFLLAVLAGCSPREAIKGLSGFIGAEEESRQEVETILKENQREIYGKVTSAVGNEITIALGSISQGRNSSLPEEVETGNNPKNPSKGEGRRSTGNPSRNSGEHPSPGSMPEIGGGPDGAFSMENMPDISDPGQGEAGRMGQDFSNGGMGLSLELTGEEKSYLIPPSVPVEYSVGGQKLTLSFTRIAKDNLLRLVLQELDSGEEAVVQVQIVG